MTAILPTLIAAPWLGLLLLVPAVAWAIERAVGRMPVEPDTGPGVTVSPRLAGLASLAGAAAVAVVAAACLDNGQAWPAALLGWTLLALARIDLSHGLLPDRLTLPLGLAGLAVAWGEAPWSFEAALLGAGAGFASLALIAALYRRWRRRDGMGLGDAKLLGAGGAWLGVAALPLTVCLAAVGALGAVLAARALGWRFEREGAIPFGPFLCLAVWIVFLTRGGML